MIPLHDIIIPTADAINYFKGGDKSFLSKIYFNDLTYQRITKKHIYFLLGDKGTGKTAFAVNQANNEPEDLKSALKFTSETDFKKFIKLIQEKKVTISDFVSIWKVILLLIVSKEIRPTIHENYFNKFFVLSKIDKAINQYYKSAFAPEIANAIEIVDKADIFLEILSKFQATAQSSKKVEQSGMQLNLLEIENQFKKALTGINLKKSFILFIDGTDQIPLDINRRDYEECLRGLANAIWELNSFIFPELLSGEKYYIKVVLLMRPDIFSIIRFHNANAKLKDNSLILDWVTKENNWRNSRLFKMADNLFASQQSTNYALGYSWANYCEEKFRFQTPNGFAELPSFVAIMRRTFMRPRDIFSLLDIMHQECIKLNLPKITSNIFNDCQLKFSRYLLGEIKDQFNFFHTDDEWQIMMDFFRYFNGRTKFDYKYFLDCYNRFISDYPDGNPYIFETPDHLLQDLYSNNVICYIEESSEDDLNKWSYKEKNYTNLYPPVEFECEYMFHIGIARAIGIGKSRVQRRS